MATFVAERQLLTTRQTAEVLGVSQATVRRLVAASVLEPVRLAPGGRLRFRREDVAELVEGGRERGNG